MRSALFFCLIVAIPVAASAQHVSFLAWKLSPSNPTPGSFAIADFNGDGKPDAVVNSPVSGSTQAFVFTMLGNGDGTFDSPPNMFTSICPAANPACDTVQSVYVADFNHDGKPDLLVLAGTSASILLGNGDGSFRLAHQLQSYTGSSYPVIADFNGDGRLDIAMANVHAGSSGNPEVELWLGNGDGTFQPPADTRLAGTVLGTGDFNNDLHADLVLAVRPNLVQVYLGNGDGTFRLGSQPDITSVSLSPTPVGDLNGDGKPDFVVCPESAPPAPTCSAFLGNGDGTFQRADTPNFVVPVAGAPPSLADFNGDAKLDLVIGLMVLLGNGDGTFVPPVEFGSSRNVVAADLNSDGKIDLVADGPLAGGLTALLNDSPGHLPVLTVVSAAYNQFLAVPGSFASAFGNNLAISPVTASGGMLPTTLGGVSLSVEGTDGVTRAAPLLYVSPGQINFLVPAGTPTGLAAFNVIQAGGPPAESRVNVLASSAPAIFSADGSGAGLAAAIVITVDSKGNQSANPIFQCSPGSCQSLPIHLSGATTTYLAFFLTGIPTSATNLNSGVSAYFNGTGATGGVSAPVYYLGPQGQYPGLYQLNVMVPVSFRPSGFVPFELEFAPDRSTLYHSNTVTVEFR